MARKTKNIEKQTDEPPKMAAVAPESKSMKASRRAPARPKKSAAKATKKTAKGEGATAATASHLAEPTDEQIRLRAYFISERRHRLALPGDASSDWIEARRQLLAESGSLLRN